MQPRVFYGKNQYAKLGFARDAYATIPINQYKQLQANVVIQPKLVAPLVKNQAYGNLNVTLNGQTVNVYSGGGFGRRS